MENNATALFIRDCSENADPYFLEYVEIADTQPYITFNSTTVFKTLKKLNV